jgi:hypothetical protein
MALYSFQTDDGEEVERRFPMGECPKEITLDDGRIAKRVFGVPYVSMFGGGHASGDGATKLNADMKRRQEVAGKRMRDNWKSVKDK